MRPRLLLAGITRNNMDAPPTTSCYYSMSTIEGKGHGCTSKIRLGTSPASQIQKWNWGSWVLVLLCHCTKSALALYLKLEITCLVGWKSLRVEASFCSRCVKTSGCCSPSKKWETIVRLNFENLVYPVQFHI